MDITILLLSMCVFFAVGMPIAYALALAALVGAWWIDVPIEAVMQQLASGVGKVSMLTVPFFVLAGAIMAEGGMARRLVDLASVIVGFTRMRGGLSQVNILATTIMSGISGSSVADTSAIGSVMIPQMAEKGYPRVFATNVTICASVQAILVPPSHNTVIYSLATGGTVSIASLFLAGIIPGLLLGFSISMLCLFYAYRDKHPKGEPVPLKQAARILYDASWGIVTLIIVLGGILTGVFTPIEAGAVACVWAFFVTMFIYRDYKWAELPRLAYRTLQTVAMVLTLVATASCFGYVAALMQMPYKMTQFFVAISSNKYMLLMWLNIMLLVLGTALDLAPLLLICTPILLPVIKQFGIDPVHFGIVMLLNLGIGLLTPPVGTTLFVGCAIGKVSVDDVMREIWPFYYVMFTVLMLVTYIPALSLWLPKVWGF
jgi:tripartite ATP-independent transporter DctM subunit